MFLLRRKAPIVPLGSAPAGEVLESAFSGLVPRRFSGLLAVAVDDAGPHVWSTGSWGTLPSPDGERGRLPSLGGEPQDTSPVGEPQDTSLGGEPHDASPDGEPQDASPDGEPHDAEPVFQIGSVTKVFTAVLLARAVASGEVELDAPVEDVLGIPLRVGGRPVTYRHLAIHRSGLPRVPKGMRGRVEMSDPYRTYDTDRLREAVAEARDQVKAGRDASIKYSNFGFAVLGLALGECLRTPWEVALRERVLGPAGLSATGVRPAAPRAVLLDKRGTPVQPWDLAAFAPAGALWMSGRDLAAWLVLLTETVRAAAAPGGAATDRDQVRQAVQMTLEPQAKSIAAHVGLAWHLFERDGVTWHNGGVLGGASFVGLDINHARAIGVFAVGNPHHTLDRAAVRALIGR